MRIINSWTITGEVLVDKRRWCLVRCVCGYEGRRRLDHLESGRTKACKSCTSKRTLVEHPNKVFGSTEHKGVGGLGRTFWGTIKHGAKRRNIPFDIDIEYAWSLFTGRCALSGIPITLSSATVGSNPDYANFTASLDRKDSRVGYVVGNVQWVHKTINYIKRDLSDDEFSEWCRRVAEKK